MNDAQQHPENAVNRTDQANTNAAIAPGCIHLQLAHRAIHLRWAPGRDIAMRARRASINHAWIGGGGGETDARAPVDLGETEKEHQALIARLLRDGDALRRELGLPGFPAPEDPAADIAA
ncbi:hypothetical protein [Streptomyces xantholiticus]|uniref:hypothetical protein n=1 Tax=Streptomyces xantholiticus TaxID=68285 RepID=UPI0016770BBB|nr:hypothetical protein [Streptomyces xantholiticus]